MSFYDILNIGLPAFDPKCLDWISVIHFIYAGFVYQLIPSPITLYYSYTRARASHASSGIQITASTTLISLGRPDSDAQALFHSLGLRSAVYRRT